MKIYSFLFNPLFFIASLSFSQEFSQNVISNQGNFDKNENITLEWTLGDPFVETVVTSDKIFTQGFQQALILAPKFLNTKDNIGEFFTLHLYPNPVKSFLNVNVNEINHTILNISLYDLTGKNIKTTKATLTHKGIVLDLIELKSGIYLIKFTSDDVSFAEIHKIIKL